MLKSKINYQLKKDEKLMASRLSIDNINSRSNFNFRCYYTLSK